MTDLVTKTDRGWLVIRGNNHGGMLAGMRSMLCVPFDLAANEIAALKIAKPLLDDNEGVGCLYGAR